ncbi:MAG TPA: non-ribosomal peptide synthetase [Acidobacteriota bacterium]|nr:non-ribosomal peptide synthetase [Acidobacteriota bacterium]
MKRNDENRLGSDAALVIDRFESAAAGRPDAVALVCLNDEGGEHQVSYRLLNAMASRLAFRLIGQGVAAESIVGVAVDHDLASITSILAVLKTGACFLPLDGALPELRLRAIARDSGLQLILAPKSRSARYAALQARVMEVDPFLCASDGEQDVSCPRLLFGLNPVYVIYTSGSTGEPKGVVVTQQGLANHNRGFADIIGLDESEVVLQFASLSFDAAYEEIFPALGGGARLVLRSSEMGQDVELLLRTCREQQITLLDLPTAFWHLLSKMLSSEGLSFPDSVGWIVLGGEEALAAHLRYWIEQGASHLRILNTYGPTEGTIIATSRELLHSGVSCEEGIPLGESLPATSVALYQGHEPCPPGQSGEIHISGLGVARGYLNSPGLTGGRFIPDAGSGEGERAYRSGDLAQVSDTGEMLFRGRADNQVKLRGHRIQLEEVENALRRHPAIESCAVMMKDDRSGGKHLIAYAVLAREQHSLPFENNPVSVMALKEHLRERLPETMIPRDFSFLEKFILTPAGKVDRSKLPEIGHWDLRRRKLPDFQKAKEGVETRLLEIWCDVLDLDTKEVSVEDPFEYLGGNSLYSIQVRYKAQEAGLLFKASDLHLRQTIRGLARCCRSASGVLSRARHALVDYFNYARGLGRVMLRGASRSLDLDRRRQESRYRRMLEEFYQGLENRRDVFYLFFTPDMLHWLWTTLQFVPRDCNLVLIGSGLRDDELAWVKERIERPFLHLPEEIDLDMIWDILFAVNKRNFGWLDVDCLVMNPSLFKEMASIKDDEAINCMWTHAACGPTKRPFHVLETYFLFFNIKAIEDLRRRGVLPRPSATTANLRQIEVLKRLIPAEEGRWDEFGSKLGGGAFAHRLLDFTFAPLILFQLLANASGYRLNRVRFFTEIDTFNPFNYYSDEAIHVFPSIRHFERRTWDTRDQQFRLATDYLLMNWMFDELPPSYQQRKEFLDGKLHILDFDIAQAPLMLRRYLSSRGVSERTFRLPAMGWMMGTPRHPRQSSTRLAAADVAAVS